MTLELKYAVYFLLGGTMVTVVTYFASHAKGLLAAFFANLPVITLITFMTIYYESGEKTVVSYAQGLVVMLVPWLAYIFSVILLVPRLGVVPSLAVGLTLYLSLAYAIMSLKKP